MEQVEFEKYLSDAETKLIRLKALYEQWFQGIEKLEPHVPKRDFERLMELMKKNPSRNTALRFRFGQLNAKYSTFQALWIRTARRIEEGTYEHHVAKARRKANEQKIEEQRKKGLVPELPLKATEQQGHAARGLSSELDLDIEFDDRLSSEIQASSELKAFKAPVRKQPSPQQGVGIPPQTSTPSQASVDLQKLFSQYSKAKLDHEGVKVGYQSLEKSVTDMIPKLKAKHGADKNIDFEVVCKDGKVGLKPKIS